jgi:hypothetical protein
LRTIYRRGIDPEEAACKQVGIANSVEAVQDSRIDIEPINWPFPSEHKGSLGALASLSLRL